MAGPTGGSGPDIAGDDRVNIGFIIAIVAVATIGGLLFGYDSGAVNGTQAGLQAQFNLDANGLGFTVGSLLIGCAFGAFFAGRLADLVGRRTVMIVSALLFLFGALIQGVTDVHAIFVAARFAGGMAVGAASVLSPLYISEVAPAKIRGRMSTVQQVMIISGLTAAFLVNYFLAQNAGSSLGEIAGTTAWRWMYLAQAAPAAVFLLALFLIPESPRYLVMKGKDEAARAVLTRLFGAEAAERKIGEIRASFNVGHKPSFRDIAGKFGFRPIVWAGLILATFQQFVGINIIFYYGETLWRLAGVSEEVALERNIISGAVSIGAVLLALAVIDRIGRKPLLLIGSVGMALTLGAMTWAFSGAGTDAAGNLTLGATAGLTALVAANLYVIFFNFSWGPVMWVMLGEMFPNQMRGSALAVCGLAQWGANYLVVQSFPGMAEGIGLVGTYALYTIAAVISIFLVRSFIKETKGKELEEMTG
ncbi:sugar porter family MFS transporter [Brevundimonas sp. FT23028]|uniref:sugar porter family MFS transporter n=1 Tax=Brevundimonas sp. FT23028 TaxID=3393748 RepID=UPI003B589AD1